MAENQPTTPNNQPGSAPGSSANTWLIAIIVIVLVIVGIFALANNDDQTESESNTTEGEQTIDETGASTDEAISAEDDQTSPNNDEAGEVKTFQVNGQNFSFSPNQLTVKKGDTVKIVFASTDGFHDFVIDEFNARTEHINTGQTSEVTFVADKAGTFEFYCSVGNHRAMGMVGALTVEE